MTESYRFGRQRLAWITLAGSFFCCLVFGVAIPLGLNAFVQNSKQSLDISVQANQGTVGIEELNGSRRVVLVGEPPEPIDISPTSIRTDTTASALLTISPPDRPEPVMWMQVASNSSVQIDEASTPRFGFSNNPHRFTLDLQAGRVRLDVPAFDERNLNLLVTTPQGGTIDVLDPGRYTFEVNNDAAQVTVQSGGKAFIQSQGETLELQSGARAEVPTESPPLGPLSPARDLIQNGDFSDSFDNWALFSWRVELPDQPEGETAIQLDSGDPMLRFARTGIGHADTRITQSVNQDVSDYESLRLATTLRIVDQSLDVCGVQGSECPLLLIVNYIDDSGVSRVWQHGFFAKGTIDDNLTPGSCISCAVVQRPHDRVPLGQLYFYDVDLRQELASQGALPPRFIESITLVGSGHSFVTDVSDVAIIVE